MSSPFRALRTSSPSVGGSDNLFDTVLPYRVEGIRLRSTCRGRTCSSLTEESTSVGACQQHFFHHAFEVQGLAGGLIALPAEPPL